jgi:hypothetical protein
MPFVLLISGCVKEERPVTFQDDVQPILNTKRIECHIPPGRKGHLQSGLSLARYEDFMKGTIYGPVIVRGDNRRSILNMTMFGRVDRSINVPHEWELVGLEEVDILRLWVEYGAANN